MIVELVLRSGDQPDPRKILDLVVLVIPGGRERDEGEHRALLDRAGFRLTKVIRARSSVSVVEAIPA